MTVSIAHQNGLLGNRVRFGCKSSSKNGSAVFERKARVGVGRCHRVARASHSDQVAAGASLTNRTRPDYIPGVLMIRITKSSISPDSLSKLGVDIIEAGFPVASPDDFEAVKAIATEVGNEVHPDGYVPVICGLSRTRENDLKTAWEAVKMAKRPRVHTFIATSRFI
eukprot:jgi/Picre1/31162/NNA_006516.t1